MPEASMHAYRGSRLAWSFQKETNNRFHERMSGECTVSCAIGKRHASKAVSLSPLPLSLVLFSRGIRQCSFAVHLALLDLSAVYIPLPWESKSYSAQSGAGWLAPIHLGGVFHENAFRQDPKPVDGSWSSLTLGDVKKKCGGSTS